MNKAFLLLLVLLCTLPAFSLEDDFLADELNKTKIKKPVVNLDYNYKSTAFVPIRLKITHKISTKDKDLYEGKVVTFRVEKSSFYKGRPVVREGDVVKAKINSVISSGLNGIPYSILIDDFEIKNLDSNKLKGGYEKSGFNRTYFVLPLKWMLTPLPPTGSLTNFIKGGHAKITERDDITLYYYPEWGK